ncbi:GNAT family N-acetyltransferase [Methylobacterium tarhaniae]|uniref:GNAT family N-acetyltransferase n=1 Tax=Methylobacterium tarhaniae TaxID=1187852 RepID=UPI000AF687B2|nr:GNAT family N-acetyltransferase [Methylobacterium tarhaniae]
MPDLTVRRAQKPDLPAVLGLYAELNGGRVATLPQAEALLDRLASYPDYGLYLAEMEGRVVGTFCLVILDNIAHWGTPSALVESVVVSAAERGTGLGRRMMREAGRLATEKGCYKLALSSNVDAKPAHRFYESLGFEAYGYSFRLDPPFTADAGRSADGEAAGSPSPRGRGEAFTPLVGGEGSAKREDEGGFREEPHSSRPPHPRSGCASASSADDKVAGALSPPAGRGEVPRLSVFPNSPATHAEETA